MAYHNLHVGREKSVTVGAAPIAAKPTDNKKQSICPYHVGGQLKIVDARTGARYYGKEQGFPDEDQAVDKLTRARLCSVIGSFLARMQALRKQAHDPRAQPTRK